MILLKNATTTRKRLVIIVVVLLGLFLAVYAFLISPLSPLHMCTLMGCRDALELSLDHEPLEEYLVQVQANNGETQRITCMPGKAVTQSSGTSSITAVCQMGKITFLGLSPAEVKIDITWEGGHYSTSGHPTYQPFRPNGRFCPPTCQSGKLSIKLP